MLRALLAALMVRPLAWSMAATFPSTDTLPGLDRVDPKPTLRQILREAPGLFVVGLVGSWVAFVLTPLITIGWPLPAFLLSAGALDRHAYGMAGHKLYLMRQAMLMLKTVGGAIWGADTSIRAALGLPAYGDDPGTFRGDLEVQADLIDAPPASPPLLGGQGAAGAAATGTATGTGAAGGAA